jgi:hypothetical protein
MLRVGIISLLALCTLATKGFCQEEPAKAKNNSFPTLLEVKAGYFFFSDPKMRKIYDQGGLDVQLCVSSPVWKWLQIYGSIEFFKKEGRTLNAHEKVNIWEIPLSVGLKPVARIASWIHYYATLGPRYFFVHAYTSSPYLNKRMSDNGLGGFVNTGFNFFPYRGLFIDIFGEYSYKRMHFHSGQTNVSGSRAQVGGFTFGGGLGYAF